MKTTLLSHIYNEEYLLPFWLEHHKPIFDNLVIIDYNSTDKSIEICKSIWPDCRIIQSRNEYFDAVEIDKEIMDIESEIEGIKMVLNTTEFLLSNIDIKTIFNYSSLSETTLSCSIFSCGPYSRIEYNPSTNKELYAALLNEDVKFHMLCSDRGVRQLHNFKHGNYTLGRHNTTNPARIVNSHVMCIMWLGFFPMNTRLLERKLQIKNKMSEFDKNNHLGFQHLYDKEKLIDILNQHADTGTKFMDISPTLYELIKNKASL